MIASSSGISEWPFLKSPEEKFGSVSDGDLSQAVLNFHQMALSSSRAHS